MNNIDYDLSSDEPALRNHPTYGFSFLACRRMNLAIARTIRPTVKFYQGQSTESTPNVSSPLSVVSCSSPLTATLEPSPPTSNGREALRLAPLAYCLLVSSDEGQNRLNYANALVG
jgi:hypothetical protein